MSDQIFRRSPSIRSRNFQPSAGNSPQNSPRRRTPTNRNRLALPRKRILPERVLSRTYSDSFLLKSSDLEVVAVEDCGYDRSPVPETEEGSLFPGLLRQHYFAYEKDVSLSSVSMNNLFAGRSYSFRNEKYNDDTKLGLNVHVEGSSGPIKVKMKMGDTAEGMIKGVLAQYALESRWPALECDSNGYELHYSRHDLEGICRSAKIGDLYLGTRSFYLRKISTIQPIVIGADAKTQRFRAFPVHSAPKTASFVLHPLFDHPIVKKFTGKIGRRIRKLWVLFHDLGKSRHAN